MLVQAVAMAYMLHKRLYPPPPPGPTRKPSRAATQPLPYYSYPQGFPGSPPNSPTTFGTDFGGGDLRRSYEI